MVDNLAEKVNECPPKIRVIKNCLNTIGSAKLSAIWSSGVTAIQWLLKHRSECKDGWNFRNCLLYRVKWSSTVYTHMQSKHSCTWHNTPALPTSRSGERPHSPWTLTGLLLPWGHWVFIQISSMPITIPPCVVRGQHHQCHAHTL